MAEERVLIRAAGDGDFSAIHGLLCALDEVHVRIRPDVFQAIGGEEALRGRIEGLIGGEESEIFVAEVGSEVLGLVSVEIKDAPDGPMFRARKYAAIDDLIVGEAFRGMGIGKRLLDRVAAWARARGMRSIDINVWVENEAGMSFFAANGFVAFCQRMELRIDEG